MKKKWLIYCRLMRIDKPIGTFLLLWPTLWALWISTVGSPPFWFLVVFISGVWLMRTAGCIINDYIDCKFDGHVRRTAHRPLPNNVVTKEESLILFIVLVLLSFLLVLTMNIVTIALSIIALILTWIYPFMKRYTSLAQVVLGVTFSWPILMVFTAVNKAVTLSCWLIFLANTLWVISYDTQYAMIDRDDDVKISIKSTAIFFGKKDKLMIGLLQITSLIVMIIVSYLNDLNKIFYLSILIAGMLFIYQQKLITNRDRNACFKAFMSNNYVGLILFLGIVESYLC